MSTATTRSQPSASGPALATDELLRLYRQMVLIRRWELKAQEVYKAGEMPGFIHLYVGEEATAVGVCAHLRRDDWITSTHRGHGHALAKGVPPESVLAELYGRAGGCCGGRGGSMHLYAPKYGLFGSNGFVGGGLPPSVGLAMAAAAQGIDRVAVAFFGDGAVNHGTFHESVNFAGVQRAPVVFVCENNLYATATPLTMATLNTEIATKAAAYGIPGVAVDGNDVLAVWETAGRAIERARAGEGPTLIEAKTYRTVGHHEGDPLVGTYRTQEELDRWKLRCPIASFRKRLVEWGRATPAELDALDADVDEQIQAAVEFARRSPQPNPAAANDHVWGSPLHPPIAAPQQAPKTNIQGWLEAVRDGLAEEMRRDPHILYFGEGTGERGGTFGHTKNLWHEFGARRMVDTPIAELGFTGAAIGASAAGCRTVADVMFADFLFEAASQIIQQAGKLRYMSGGQVSVPLVVRAPMGTIKNTGPHHSGAYYPIWAHCPGLIVVVPSNPADAKGLMKTALRSSDPVLFMEPKSLFPTKGPVPEGEHLVPLGVAAVPREGSDLTIVACGAMVPKCLEAATKLEAAGTSCEVVDLRTIVPLDVETIAASIRKTGKLLVVDEAYAMCGLGAELAAVAQEHAFDYLDAPVGRLHTDPVAQPFSPAHEGEVVVTVDKIVAAARAVIDGLPIPPRRLQASGKDAGGSAASSAGAAASAAAANATRSAAVSGVPLVMPNLDLTITEATVVAWLKNVGDRVAKGEAVIEMETDKATVPVDSPADGVLAETLVSPGDVVPLGGRLGTIGRIPTAATPPG